MNPPTASLVREARRRSGLTQPQAAALVYLADYRRWLEYETGVRRMDRARWELFLIKTGLHHDSQIINNMLVLPMPFGDGRLV